MMLLLQQLVALRCWLRLSWLRWTTATVDPAWKPTGIRPCYPGDRAKLEAVGQRNVLRFRTAEERRAARQREHHKV